MTKPKPKFKTEITKVSSLLDESDAQSTKALESYVQACELLHSSYSRRIHGRVEDYMILIVKESELLGRHRSRFTFFNMWKVALALVEERCTKQQLLGCTSRNEMQRIIPVKKPRRQKISPMFTTIRVSIVVHDELLKLAKKSDVTISDIIERLLAPPAKRKAA
jgi:hypothetical protein